MPPYKRPVERGRRIDLDFIDMVETLIEYRQGAKGLSEDTVASLPKKKRSAGCWNGGWGYRRWLTMTERPGPRQLSHDRLPDLILPAPKPNKNRPLDDIDPESQDL